MWLLSPIPCSNWAWLSPEEVCWPWPCPRKRAVFPPHHRFLSGCSTAVYNSPPFCCAWPSWEVSAATSDWISLSPVHAYKEVQHPQRSPLLSPMGARSMLVLLAEGWNQLTVLALPAGAASAGVAGACSLWPLPGPAASCGREPVAVLLTPSLGEVLAGPGPGWSWSTVRTF